MNAPQPAAQKVAPAKAPAPKAAAAPDAARQAAARQAAAPQAAAPSDATLKGNAEQSIRALRKRRARGLLARLGAFVILPTLLVGLYAAFWASDAYESVALYSIQNAEGGGASPMAALMGVTGISGGAQDTLAARDFALSREMLKELDERTQLLDHYRSPNIDYFSRLPADDSFEEAFEYYLDRVRVSFDSSSSVLSLHVRAYSAEKAHQVAQAVLQASEERVNELSERARDDQIKFALGDLHTAEKRLAAAREKLVEIQQKYGEFSPQHTAQAALTIRTQMESALAQARAEYATLSSYMAEDSPQVIAAREKVKSLAGQAATENQRLVKSDEKGLNTSAIEFEKVLVEKEFATQAYQSTLASLEVAKAEAARQHRYLSTISHPSLPDEAMYPRRFLLVLTAFALSLVLFGIVSLGWAAIKEHARL